MTHSLLNLSSFQLVKAQLSSQLLLCRAVTSCHLHMERQSVLSTCPGKLATHTHNWAKEKCFSCLNDNSRNFKRKCWLDSNRKRYYLRRKCDGIWIVYFNGFFRLLSPLQVKFNVAVIQFFSSTERGRRRQRTEDGGDWRLRELNCIL